MAELSKICDDIIQIEEDLMYGEISFSYDTLMTVMGAGHPADILDGILSPVFWPVQSGKTVENDLVLKLYKDIVRFKNSFKVKELSPVISELEEYLKAEGIEVKPPRISHEEIKRRYVGKTLDKEKFRAAGDVWNLEVKNGVFTGHFYWNNDKHTYYDNFRITVDDSMKIFDIDKLDTCTADGGYVDPCRYTFEHNEEFDKLLKSATG